MRHSFATFVPLCAGALILLAGPSALAQESDRDLAKRLSNAFSTVAEQSSRAMVELEVYPPPARWNQPLRKAEEWFSERLPLLGPAHGEGKAEGYVVSPDGLILTNYHAVADAQEIVAHFADGREAVAEVIGNDPESDLVMLRVPLKGLYAYSYADSDHVRPGQLVLGLSRDSLGAPVLGMGILSRSPAMESNLGAARGELLTDALSPFSHQGIVIDLEGRLVGVATHDPFMQREAHCPIIPAKTIKVVQEALLSKGHVARGYLGVHVQELSRALARAFEVEGSRGALVSGVEPGSPAAEAGIEVGDVIVGLNGTLPLRKGVSWLTHKISMTPPGTRYTVKILRRGERFEFPVTLGERQAPIAAKGPLRVTDLGLEVRQLSPTLAERYGFAPTLEGVVVTHVVPGGVAAAAGLEPGYLITHVNRREIRRLTDYESAMEEARRKHHVALLARTGSARSATFFGLEYRATGAMSPGS